MNARTNEHMNIRTHERADARTRRHTNTQTRAAHTCADTHTYTHARTRARAEELESQDEGDAASVAGQSSSASASGQESEDSKVGKGKWNQLRYHLHKAAKEGQPELLEGYKKLRSQASKRDFLQNFSLEKTACSLRAVENCTVHTDKEENRQHGWLTRAQILKEEGNDEEVTEALTKELPSRPHERKSLGDKGVMQYHYTWNREKESKGTKRAIGIEADSACPVDVYEEIEKHMLQPLQPTKRSKGSQPPQSRRTRPQPQPSKEVSALTEEEKSVRDQHQKLRKDLKMKMMELANLKKKCDEAVGKINVEEKPWMESMLEKYKEEFSAIVTLKGSVEGVWAGTTEPTEASNKDLSTAIKDASVGLQRFKDFRKQVKL